MYNEAPTLTRLSFAPKTGCVVVSCNYRLGIFGFLGSRALAAEEPGAGCGNYGELPICPLF